MKVTLKQLREIDTIYGKLLANANFNKTKLGYAFKRFSDKNTVGVFKELNEVLQDIRIDHAMVDATTGAILYKDDGVNFQYTKDGLKSVLKDIRRINDEWDAKEFEVEPYVCKEYKPEDLDILDNDEVELLKGIIINKEKS